ncbi:hypothetical protein MYP_908 [Sporocytophaga myxococcoides]|uniref:Uncharacterized protein n=1 Tax=Sporocytophaga myxococcoides TaxID=153721 RepID=A0A098L9P0_9BACT|nr:hypothetical protein MYP_908 [Sporocytophaga myxococcoides]
MIIASRRIVGNEINIGTRYVGAVKMLNNENAKPINVAVNFPFMKICNVKAA